MFIFFFFLVECLVKMLVEEVKDDEILLSAILKDHIKPASIPTAFNGFLRLIKMNVSKRGDAARCAISIVKWEHQISFFFSERR